ncbi:MAG: DUF4349 domain-containing protein [Bacteroidales bacterium]
MKTYLKMTHAKYALMVLVLLVSMSCGKSRSEAKYIAPILADEVVADRNAEPAPPAPNENFERKLIKRGDIRFQTKSIAETSIIIKSAVSGFNGYISSENVYNSDDMITQHVEIRVPAASFDALLAKISESAKRIDSKSIQVQDVTEEYIDVESRLKTKKELENRYREILTKARTVEEILSIERELGNVRSDIEATEGRLKYLGSQVSFSSLSVDYYELTRTTGSFSSKIGMAFTTGWKLMLGFIVGIVNLWPFLLIVASVLYIVIRFSRKKS